MRHPFPPLEIFSEDEVANVHETAMAVLEELGLKILLPEARRMLSSNGAIVDESSNMVRIGRDMVEDALQAAPRSIRLRAANADRELLFEPGALLFSAGAGCPNVTDLERGRRPGSLKDFEEAIKLQQSFDVIHKFSPSAEPQDVPANIRHYAMIRAQLLNGDKSMFVYSRGRGQVEESFELIRLGLDLSEDDFVDGVWAATIVNTNSPRQIDVAMAEGIIDFARAGQLCVMTPFCLAGAMAPITVAGALVLQHAEALGCIVLSQLARRGAPVAYGGFASNVDMKSGAPAFGTPEQIRMSLGSGQLARHVGLPWRSSAASAANVADMQAAGETHMSLWGALMANATVVLHAAGWLEGGLTFGYEKFINDIEALQTIAELCRPVEAEGESLAWEAIKEVEPGGHFFAAEQTMKRYRDEFYPPFVADLRNHGTWLEAGGRTSTERALEIWKRVLDAHRRPQYANAAEDRIAGYIAERVASGGSPPAGT